MKNQIFILIAFPFLLKGQNQDPREAEIRRLENIEREATMKGDSATLFGKIWSNEMVVNTPANRVGTVEGTKMQMRTGNLAYASFERNIEKITFNDNIAMVMGEEIVKPQGKQLHAGQTVTRRFTNIWKFTNNQWAMIGRHATIIKIAPLPISEEYKAKTIAIIDSLMDYQSSLVLKQDTAAMNKFYPDDMIITNPFHMMINKKTMLDRVMKDIIKYDVFEKKAEHYHFEGENVVVVIGKEHVVPTKDADRYDAGKEVNRRFTEVWFKREGTWKRVIRHAHNITK